MRTATATRIGIGSRVRVTGDTMSLLHSITGETGTVIGRSAPGSITFDVERDMGGSRYVHVNDLENITAKKSNKSLAGTVLQKMKRGQNSDVLLHLIKKGNISQLEADSLYRVKRLASRIGELKKQVGIRVEIRHDLTGKRYARYFLA